MTVTSSAKHFLAASPTRFSPEDGRTTSRYHGRRTTLYLNRKKMRDLKRKILTDLKVELLDEFDRNFQRRAFFDRPWPGRKSPGNGDKLLNDTGYGRNSIRGIIRQNGVEFSTDTPYMGLHNRGGKIKITPRMRKYFWYMYRQNTESITYSIKKRQANNTQRNRMLSAKAQFWKNMALTKKDHITIPQRQFIGDHPRVRQAVREVIHQNLQSAFRELAKVLQPR